MHQYIVKNIGKITHDQAAMIAEGVSIDQIRMRGKLLNLLFVHYFHRPCHLDNQCIINSNLI